MSTHDTHEKILILSDIRSVYNTGSLFRTAEAIGIDKLYLAGYTPTPVDRFGRVRNDLAKTALGAEKLVPWEKRKDTEALIHELKKSGVAVIAIEQAPTSRDYKEITIEGSTALIVGNEPDGIPQNILDECDSIIEIPMNGEKESLNVAVAGGIALYRLFDQ